MITKKRKKVKGKIRYKLVVGQICVFLSEVEQKITNEKVHHGFCVPNVQMFTCLVVDILPYNSQTFNFSNCITSNFGFRSAEIFKFVSFPYP
jgi:hypothetical protein